MNYILKNQIENLMLTTKTLELQCKMSTIEDDGKKDKEETKKLKALNKATIKYIKELKKINNGYADIYTLVSLASLGIFAAAIVPLITAGPM